MKIIQISRIYYHLVPTICYYCRRDTVVRYYDYISGYQQCELCVDIKKFEFDCYIDISPLDEDIWRLVITNLRDARWFLNDHEYYFPENVKSILRDCVYKRKL